EVGRIPPRCQGQKTLVSLAVVLGFAGVQVGADAAAVDLTGAQMHQVDNALGQAVVIYRGSKRLERLNRGWGGQCGVLQSGLCHVSIPPSRWFVHMTRQGREV